MGCIISSRILQVQDEYGSMITAYMEKIQSTNPLEAELHALQRGLQICMELRLDKLCIEGDSIILVSAIQSMGNVSRI